MAIMVSDHSNTALPSGWPLNRSSNRPSGNPAQTGSKPGRTSRQATSIKKPTGGTSGSAVATKSIGSSEPSIIESHGTASAMSGECSRLMRRP